MTDHQHEPADIPSLALRAGMGGVTIMTSPNMSPRTFPRWRFGLVWEARRS